MIPTGLQALMEASMVLQQQASQTAPGPQGQQPTVANQVIQQAQQASQPQMPQMQDIGKQAGIAGQLMAQRQQQQQQMAQNPEAIAQMAAQMLQQKGVASLPSNMQFRDGGIIGYAGPDGSVVANPVADRDAPDFRETLFDRVQRELQELQTGERDALSPDIQAYLQRKQNMEQAGSMGERADQIRLQKGSIYASPEERARTAERFAQNPYSSSAPMANKEVREMYEGLGEQQRAIRGTQYATQAEQDKAAQAKKQLLFTPMSQFRERLQAGQDPTATADFTQAPRDTSQVPSEELSPEERRRLSGVGGIPIRRSSAIEPSNIAYAGPDERFAPSLGIERTAQDKSGASAAPKAAPSAGMDASDASLGGTKPAGIAALQRAELPKLEVKPSTESPQMTAARQQLKELRDQRIAAAERQEDLTPQGIAALQAAQSERKKLLEASRGRDTYERLNALFTSMRTLGNEVGNVQRAIHAREEAAVTADLLHADSVLKLKQAQQARELGKLDQAIALRNAGVNEQQESEKILALRDKNAADMALAVYGAQSREATHFADRANAMNMKLIELKQQADIKNEERLLRQAINLQSRLNATTNGLNEARLKLSQELKNSAEFKAIESLKSMESKGLQLSPEQKKQLKDYEKFASDKEAEVVNTYLPRLQVLYKELGVEMPQAPARTTTSAVSFSSLPTK